MLQRGDLRAMDGGSFMEKNERRLLCVACLETFEDVDVIKP